MALLALAAFSNMAQAAGEGLGFKLWFANNVTDVENFDKITTSTEVNFRKQIITFKTNVSFLRDSTAGKHENETMTRQRKELKGGE